MAIVASSFTLHLTDTGQSPGLLSSASKVAWVVSAFRPAYTCDFALLPLAREAILAQSFELTGFDMTSTVWG